MCVFAAWQAVEHDPFVYNESADKTLAAQPWTKSIEPLHPNQYVNAKPDLSFPDTSLELDWVYGYR